MVDSELLALDARFFVVLQGRIEGHGDDLRFVVLRVLGVQRKLRALQTERLWDVKTENDILLTCIGHSQVLGLHDLMRSLHPFVLEMELRWVEVQLWIDEHAPDACLTEENGLGLIIANRVF